MHTIVCELFEAAMLIWRIITLQFRRSGTYVTVHIYICFPAETVSKFRCGVLTSPVLTHIHYMTLLVLEAESGQQYLQTTKIYTHSQPSRRWFVCSPAILAHILQVVRLNRFRLFEHGGLLRYSECHAISTGGRVSN